MVYPQITITYSPLASYLIQEIKQRGWTRAQLAQRAAVTPMAITALINNPGRKPRATTIQSLAKALGVPEVQILDLCNAEQAQPAEVGV